ncbi:6-phosphofructokinase [uncultured Odoribacter sp.]|uniref:6-phosphofructokinase n=1 Tax=uncultured Odoribacter sp. TaxID=876416 RepID=UPI0026123545|nr:6-phosphofructokinase [uncultured Odoribacter sp.]
MGKIRKIGVLTSGGDAPGMNAAIRAVVRAGVYNGCQMFGIYDGYEGMINGKIKRLNSKDVSNIIQRGGTILKTARSAGFRMPEGRMRAAGQLAARGIDALVVIGGDGSFTGAGLLVQEHGIPVVGIPGTIDNDLFGTDCTIGYDTAVNTAVEAIDKIRDTATAHNRLFFVEVMGRDAGFIALRSGIASGAGAILVPELKTDLEELEKYVNEVYDPQHSSGIVVVAEGDEAGGAYKIAEKVKKEHPEFDIRVSVLGHIQRGGNPSSFDREVASRLGAAAIEALLDDQKSIMIGIVKGKIVHVPFNKAIKNNKGLNSELLNLVRILAVHVKYSEEA